MKSKHMRYAHATPTAICFVAQALALAKRPRGARLATLCERCCDVTNAYDQY
ncbi:MAG: hypothetical protein F6K55_06950 [Moorea sp. SIO4A3]|nr:hypothetical protein [Moorena sp. SIO4A3]NEQ88168.1 hypothetical protein [Moorena sp. SIO2I5]